MTHNLKNVFFLLGIMFFFAACQNDVVKEFVENNPVVSDFATNKSSYTTKVSVDDALNVAKLFKSTETRSVKSVKGIETIKNDNEEPFMYVVNFDNNQGFILVSATRDYYPVLAYADKGNFDINEIGTTGLSVWINRIKRDISISRLMNNSQKIKFKVEWGKYEKKSNAMFSGSRATGLDVYAIEKTGEWERNGTPYYTLRDAEEILPQDIYQSWCEQAEGTLYPSLQGIYDPLDYSFVIYPTLDSRSNHIENFVLTEWGTNGGYNDAIRPLINDTIPPVGWYGIAMAQVMRYYEYPRESFNWNQIPLTGEPTAETQRFIFDVTESIDTRYGTTDSRSSLTNISNALRNEYNYSASTPYNDDMTTVLSEINAGRPVIMEGKSEFWNYTSAWIVSGANSVYSSSEYQLVVPVLDYTDEDPYRVVDTHDTQSFSLHLVYVNWGIYGRYNGYYLYDNITQDEGSPFEADFNSNRKILTGIYPNN